MPRSVLPLRHPLKPIAQALLVVCLGMAAGASLLPAKAHAAEAGATISFDVPAGNLDQALSRFGRQAGIQIAVNAELTRGRQSPGLKGSHDTAADLRRLLAGSGLEALQDANGEYTLRKQPLDNLGESTLSAITVTADAARSATTEQTGSYTSPVLTIGKMEQSIRETPQSVTVVTRQQMDDQNLLTVEDVIAQTTGTSKSQRNFGAHVYMLRGFEIPDNNYLIDGVSGGVYSPTGWAPMDTAIFDRVEVLRGAGALAVGVGDPSGVVNMVRKRPRAESHLDITLSAGSWSNYRTEIDAGGPLNAAGTLRGRVVAAYQDNDSFYDVAHSQEPMLYGVIAADLGSNTRLSAGFRHQQVNIDGYAIFGLPRFADGKALEVSRSTSLAQNWNRHEAGIDDLFAEVEQQLGGDWRAKVTANYGKTTIDQKLGTARGAVDPVTLAGTKITSLYFVDRDITSSGLDANVTGSFAALGGIHQTLFGVSWTNQESRTRSTTTALNIPVDINNFDHSRLAEPETPEFANSQKDRNQQLGVYANARLQLAEPLHLLLGGRLNWYDYRTDNLITDTVTNDYKQNAQFTPYAGLVYDLDRQWSLYTSYASTFVPQTQYSTISGSTLKPAVGTNYEAGLKGELLNGKLNVALAVFSIKKRDVALLDTANLGMCPGVTTNDCYQNVSQLRSKGIDLEVAGELTPGWQVATGYTHLETKDDAGNSISSDTPRDLLRLSTNYRLPGTWEKWTVGGAVSAQSSAYIDDIVSNPGRAILDLRTAYRVDSTWTLALNIGNVTDKAYWETIGTTRNGNYYGTPRNVTLSLRGSF